uniref:NADH dehydrogenase [ubiquinone] 1 alpha subcomplex subunit 1 n=1 Tax=Tortanus forcipatus TaxID=197020 RepID=A0A0U2VE27_9MAXI|nr:hypothetical protein [Tortanus forcipatus]
MWWEIIPPFAIIAGVSAIPHLGSRFFNRLFHDGNPFLRNFEDAWGDHPTTYWRRDCQHSYPSWWQKNVLEQKQGNGSPYRTHGLEMLD